MAEPSPIDDRPHATRANRLVEWWQFDAWSPVDELGVWVQFGWSGASLTGWYCAVVATLGGPVVLVVDAHIALGRLTPSLELRAEGIWAQHVCETPLDHWTIGLEAFGVTLDDPADALGDQWGVRTAVGLDLEWEAAAGARVIPGELRQDCMVSGEVLLDERVVEYRGRGRRVHGWGSHVQAAEVAPPADALHVPVRLSRPEGETVIDLYLDGVAGWAVR